MGAPSPGEGSRSRFAGGDPAYLRHEQYREPSRLAARTSLHLRYGTASVPWFEWVQQELALEPGMRVLDVGCGEGRLWQVAGRRHDGVRLVAADQSAGMVGATLDGVRATTAPPAASGAVVDVQHLPFDDGSFDVAVANHMLYHAPAPARAVAELARVVREDGVVVAATNGARHLAELGELRAEVFGTPLLDSTVTVFGIESGRPMLEAAFGSVRWVGYEDHLLVTDPADLMAYLCSLPPAEGATAEQLDALEAVVRRRFDEGAGTVRITKETGLFRCTAPRR